MFELTPELTETLERLVRAGFRPISIPPYEKALCIQKGVCAAVLTPIPDGGLRLLAPPSLLVEGNLSACLKRGADWVFVWKGCEVQATPERLLELDSFSKELGEILSLPRNI
jgi:hypothetical protein